MVKVLKMRDNINSEIGKFFKEYNLNNYGIDYNMKVDLIMFVENGLED